MIILTIVVEAPGGKAIGIKEDICSYLEKYGDCRCVNVEERFPKQMKFGGKEN